MVRTIGLLLGFLFVASLPAAAQDKVEVFGGIRICDSGLHPT